MFSLTRACPIPFRLQRRKLIAWQHPKSSTLDTLPPPDILDAEQCFGDYCIKATVVAKDETYVGYGQDMSIAIKTRYTCERLGTLCRDPVISFNGGKCEEVIFVKRVDGTMYPVA